MRNFGPATHRSKFSAFLIRVSKFFFFFNYNVLTLILLHTLCYQPSEFYCYYNVPTWCVRFFKIRDPCGFRKLIGARWLSLNTYNSFQISFDQSFVDRVHHFASITSNITSRVMPTCSLEDSNISVSFRFVKTIRRRKYTLVVKFIYT